MKILKPFLLVFLLIACNQKTQKALDFGKSPIKEDSRVLVDSAGIASFFVKFPKLTTVEDAVSLFYKNHNYKGVWFRGNKVNNAAKKLFEHIQDMYSDGLQDKTIDSMEIGKILGSEKESRPSLEAELKLTSSYFLYSKKVWYGMSETETQNINWHLPRKNIDFGKLLDSIIKGNLVFENPPIYRQYALLKNELKRFQKIKKDGGFPFISKEYIGLKFYDTLKAVSGKVISEKAISNLKQWFTISKDIINTGVGSISNVDLELAIIKFKTRFGLEINAEITETLISEMNVSVDDRIKQISLNLERCRWLPIGNNRDYVVINIPEYKMHVYEKDDLIFSMDAVVGRSSNETAIFSDSIEFVVFSPYWNVPNSILKKEILPGIARNANYLERHNMEWFDGKVRQKPGGSNSLGLVKFLFPNSYNIYLHDTPAKSLFEENNRAYSHGCVRLQDAEKFANYLLKNDSNWNAESIHDAMQKGSEKYVKLKKQQDVFMVYFTSWVDRKGELNFRKDIYKKDEILYKVMMSYYNF